MEHRIPLRSQVPTPASSASPNRVFPQQQPPETHQAGENPIAVRPFLYIKHDASGAVGGALLLAVTKSNSTLHCLPEGRGR